MLSALRTVHEMLRDRQYTVAPGYEWTDDSKQMIARVKKDELVVKAERKLEEKGQKPGKSDRLVVFFAIEPKVKVARVRLYKERVAKANIDHVILVYAQQVTPKAKEELGTLNVEYFKASELFRNKYYHSLVPKHERMEAAEIQALLEEKNLKSTEQLPKIRTSDWPVRYFNWGAGTVVRIYRALGAQQEPKFYYRVVTDVY